jgi:DNA helicase HerA-like ATPase
VTTYLVEDGDAAKALIAQVIDVQFAAVPGVLEELLRTLPDGGEPLQGEDIDPMEIAPHITYIQDASLLICKIRATLENEMLSPSSSWLPISLAIHHQETLHTHAFEDGKGRWKTAYHLGGTKDSSLLTIDASAIDGTLNIITGKKGCGKSHLSKLLMVNLVGYKATVVIFDLNGEYSSLGHDQRRQKKHVLRQNPHAGAFTELQGGA